METDAQGKNRLVAELAGILTPVEIGAKLKGLGLAYSIKQHDAIRAILEKPADAVAEPA